MIRLAGPLAAIVIAAGWSWPTLAGEHDAFDVRIQLKWFHQFQFAGYYAALEKGYFRDAGLNVTLLEGGPHINPTEKVLAGEAEFGIGTSGLLVTRSQGKPVVAVAAIFQHSPYVLITREVPEIRAPADLRGKTIMVEPYSEELEAYLYHEGVDLDAIETTAHTGDPLDIYRDPIVGTTAYTTTEPFVLDQRGKAYRVFDPKVAGIDFYGDTLYTTETFAREHNDEVVALRDALIRGWRYALRHQEEIVELIKREYEPEDSRAMLRYQAREIRRLLIPDLIEIGYMNPERWQHIADGFRAAGLLDSDVDIDEFIFRPAESADWQWLLYMLLGTIAVTVVVAGTVVYLYSLNRRLAAENETRIALEEELRTQAVTDYGTGVYNRRGFLEAITHELARTDRNGTPLSLIAIDLDDFKKVNDTHGHATGDRALALAASVFRDTVRGGDIIGRVGGEEFMIALPDTSAEGARVLAERVRENLGGAELSLDNGTRVAMTASIGTITRNDGEDIDAMMQRADTAMYKAKHQGGNRVVQAA
ncbi:MAG: diguanylate cyclase [Gammaproteobacteria bacterium]|nr:diguanylate cyclase [Gammaproteobacteria bacterium]